MPKRPANRGRKDPPLEKRVDRTDRLTGRRRGALIREEVWFKAGALVKFNLAYIDPRIYGRDNGRVLGFDNSHGFAHRHYMGLVERIEVTTYEALVKRFEAELQEIWRSEDAKTS